MNHPPEPPSKLGLLKWTKKILRQYGIRPRKKLSQSFIVDPQLINEILGWLNQIKPRKIYEIGAGIGTLTYYLCTRGNWKVIALEIDQRLAPILKFIKSCVQGDLEVIICDGLEPPLAKGYVDTVVSNIPYHISSKILITLYKNPAKYFLLTLQDEVARRLNAEPSSKDYGRLTIITQYIVECKLGGIYSPNSFFPPPKVFSRTVLLIKRRAFDSTALKLEVLTRCLFTERNKLAAKVMRKCLRKVDEELIKRFGSKRVRDLTLEDLLLLTQYM